MNILLLNASPQKRGATQAILDIVARELPHGASAELLCLGDYNINFCLGEKRCYETCECIRNDDMLPLLNKIDAANVLVIAAPSYWADVPAQFKAFIDRCTPYSETNPNPAHRMLSPGKKCYGIALRTGSRTSECEHIIETIRHWCGHMQIAMVGSTYFCGINDINDIADIADSLRLTVAEWYSEAQT
jgi:multimeric flavodoxin WrbA